MCRTQNLVIFTIINLTVQKYVIIFEYREVDKVKKPNNLKKSGLYLGVLKPKEFNFNV
jgi:hypothetical protein